MGIGFANTTEEIVHHVCGRSCLSLWCYANPQAKPGKELCDVLVVCDPYILIVSVKEVTLTSEGATADHYARWRRKAVEASIKQLYGAQRWLETASHVVRGDGTPGLPLPPPGRREIHRIAVAFGGQGQVSIPSGDLGKGFVHVMGEQSFLDVLAELDTVTDLVDYLAATERCIGGGCAVVIDGPESNLLGWYIYNGRSFPVGPTLLMVDDSVWQAVRDKPEFQRRKAEDEDSYVWDRLIEGLCDPRAKPVGGSGPTLTEMERAFRQMARETRFSRRGLGRAVREFFHDAEAGETRCRVVTGLSGTIYVLVRWAAGEPDDERRAELTDRCLIARRVVGQGDVVVGVGLGRHTPGVGAPSDVLFAELGEWSEVDDRLAIDLMAATGYFARATTQRRSDDEFPTDEAANG